MLEIEDRKIFYPLIEEKLKRAHRGKENAITRKELLKFAKAWKPNITDREIRIIYSQLPVCTCEKGIFYPIRKEEIQDYKIYLKKKIWAMLARWEKVVQAHPNLFSEDGEQRKLW